MADIIPADHNEVGISKFSYGTFDGPVAYPLGGMVIDLSQWFSVVKQFKVDVERVGGFTIGLLEIDKNVPVPGKVTIRIWQALGVKAVFDPPTELPILTNCSGFRFNYVALGLGIG